MFQLWHAGTTKGQSALLPTGAGPRLWWRALRQGLAMRCTSGPVNSHYSMTSELTPLYNQRTRTTLQPENSQHSTTNKLTPHLLNLEGASCRGKGKSVAIKLRNMKVSWFTDNQNVLRILKVGSCKPHLQIEP